MAITTVNSYLTASGLNFRSGTAGAASILLDSSTHVIKLSGNFNVDAGSLTIGGNSIITGSSSSEGDTLATVTARGASTSSNLSLAGNITTANGKYIGIGSTQANIEFGNGTIGNELSDLSLVTDSDGEIVFYRGQNKVIIGSSFGVYNSDFFVDTDTFYVDESADSVGIGTQTPSADLHIHGSDPVLKIRDSSTSDNTATLWLQESDTYGVKINYESNGGHGGIDYLTIDTLSAADSNNQAGNHDNAWGIDQRGNVLPHKGAVDGNLLRPYEWNLYGTQSSGGTPSFPRNGATEENERIYGENPFGEPAILWYTPSNDAGDNADGGWNSDTFLIDRGKSYRTSVWVKKTTTNTSDGNLYLGTSYVANLSNSTYNSNPYFIGGATMSTAGMETGQWYLMVGYIYDSGHTGTSHHPDGGIYDRNGKKIYTANSFKFTDSGSPTDGLGSQWNTSRQRVYNYYDATTGSKTYWWGPRFEPLEASTPTLQKILNTPSSDTGAYFMGNVGIGTSDPSAELEVKKVANDATIEVSTDGAGAWFFANSTNQQYQGFKVGHNWFMGQYASNDFVIKNGLQSNGTAVVSIADSTNSVGIGTTNPSDFHSNANRLVVGDGAGAEGITIFSQDNNAGYLYFADGTAGDAAYRGFLQYSHSTNNLSLGTAGGTKLTIASDGSVGIGSTSPLQKLDVAGVIRSSSTSRIQADTYNNSANSANIIYRSSSKTIVGNNASALVVMDGGNVGIGTTDPVVLLHVDGSSPKIRLRDNDAAGTPLAHIDASDGALKLQADSSDETASSFLTLEVDGSEHVRVASDGNVGIGTTDPSGVLDVRGDGANIFLHSNDYKIARIQPRGTSADLDKGLFSLFSTTTEAVRIDSAGSSWFNGGSVGIGTDNPQSYLDVKTQIRVRDSNSDLTHALLDSNASEGRLRLYNGSNWGLIAKGQANNPYLGAYYLGSLNIVGFTSSDASSIDHTLTKFDFANQRVGIGTTNPYSLLHIYETGAGAPQFRISRGSNNQVWVQSIDSSARFVLAEASSEGGTQHTRFQIDDAGETLLAPNGGNVGIGANTNFPTGTAPAGKLDIRGDSDGQLLFDTDGGSSDIKSSYNLELWADYDNNNSAGYSNIYFKTDGDNTRMTIDNNGKVGIGTTGPSDTLQVAGQVRIDGSTTDGLTITSNAGASQGLLLYNNSSTDTASIINYYDGPLILGQNNTEVMRIHDNGNVGIGTTDPSAKLHAEGSMLVKGDSSWAGTDNNNAAIYMNTNGRGLHGAFSSSYARNLIQANNNYIELGNQGTSLIYGFKFYAGSTTSSVGTYDFFTSGTNSRLHIEKGGNVGIGTTDPATTLDVNGNITAARFIQDTNAGNNFYAIQLSRSSASDSNPDIYGSDNGLVLGANSSEDVLKLDTGNTVLVRGGSDPDTNSYKADFAVGCGGSPQISWRNQQVQIGGTDMNWAGKVYHDGVFNVAAWSSDLRLFCQGGTDVRDIILTPWDGSALKETMRLQGDGKVGIGITSPESLLHVAGGDIRLDNAKSLLGETNGGGNFQMVKIDTSDNMLIGDGHFVIDINGTSERMRIDSAGNVGIGSTSPTVKLDVNGNIKASQVGVTNIVTNKIVKFGGTYLDDSIIYDDGTNIGIGTTSINAGAKVTIHANNTNQIHTGLVINSYQSTTATAGNGVGIVMGQNNGVYSSKIANVWTNNNPSYLQTNIAFYTMHDSYTAGSETEKMRLTSQGRLGIGVTNPSQRLEVVTNTDASAQIGRAHIGYVGFGDWAGFAHLDASSTSNYALIQNSNGQTLLNKANGQEILFRNANSTIGGFNSDNDFYVDTDTLYVDASTDRVGIGTNSPAVELDVVGTGDFDSVRILNSSASLNPRLILGRDTNQNIQFSVQDNTCTIRADQDSDSNQDHQFILNRTFAGAGENDFQIAKDGTTQVTVDTDGNVGIGSTNPTAKLDVVGTIKTKVYSISALPSASTAGQRAMVNDSYYTFGSSTIGQTVYAGGSAVAPVYSDGSYWRYG